MVPAFSARALNAELDPVVVFADQCQLGLQLAPWMTTKEGVWAAGEAQRGTGRSPVAT